jgi:hypothetical protein
MFFLAMQRRANKTNKEKKRKDAYMGLTWVSLQLPNSNSSNSRHAPAPATAPTPSSFSFDGSKALAME